MLSAPLSDRAQNVAGVLAIAACCTLSIVIARQVAPVVQNGPSGMTRAEQEHVDQAASASLLGQFRSSMSDFLWLKVDRYVHGGVELRGQTPQEKAAGNADAVTSADGGQENGNREHRGETTVIPSARRDWRGPLGDLERAVQPYQDMSHHTHRDPKEALPIFRLMTWSNPHFIPGYTVGAAMMARGGKDKLDPAIDFLKEGERNNPDSIEIAQALGEMYTSRKRDFPTGMPYLAQAMALGKARDKSTLTDDEDEAFQNAYRWAVLNRREAGDQKAARAYALEGMRLYPGDVVCRDYLARHPAP